MTKADIVNEIVRATRADKTVVVSVVEAFMESVKGSMASEEDIFLRGFGTFLIKERAEKTARNISKNTAVIIPAHKIPAFKPSKEFCETIKNK